MRNMLGRPKWIQWPWEKRNFWLGVLLFGTWLAGVASAALYWLVANFPD